MLFRTIFINKMTFQGLNPKSSDLGIRVSSKRGPHVSFQEAKGLFRKMTLARGVAANQSRSIVDQRLNEEIESVCNASHWIYDPHPMHDHASPKS